MFTKLFYRHLGIFIAVAGLVLLAAVAGLFLLLVQVLSPGVLLAIYEICGSPLGMGAATVAVLIGGSLGVAHCGPGVALAGVAVAAAISWGPGLLLQMKGVPVPTSVAAEAKESSSGKHAKPPAPAMAQPESAHAASSP